MDENGNVTTGSYDLIPVLEDFIQEHPDFSYHGARAIIGVTGYEGVFGYRTKPSYETALGTELYQKEVEDAKAVAECLKEHGWILASHSYGHPAYGNLTADRVEADSDKWEQTVEYIVGETDIILYPHGSDIAYIENYTLENEKFAALYEDGYRYFFNVDSKVAWCQIGDTYFRGSRRNIDGYRMFHHPEKLEALAEPIELDGYMIKKPKVRPVRTEPNRAILDVTIHEGRNRQVRRMCQAAGLEVARLKRIAEGQLRIGDLKTGAWRCLEPKEIEQLLKD